MTTHGIMLHEWRGKPLLNIEQVAVERIEAEFNFYFVRGGNTVDAQEDVARLVNQICESPHLPENCNLLEIANELYQFSCNGK